MNYTRWYDHDNYAKLLMSTLEQVEDGVQNDLATDLIQLIMQSGASADLDKFINDINYPYIPLRRRWYDKDETVHSAVSMVKCLTRGKNREIKKDIMKEFFYSLISYNNQESRLLEVKN